MNEPASNPPVALGQRRDLVGDAVVNVTISFPSLAVPVAEVENWHRNFVIELAPITLAMVQAARNARRAMALAAHRASRLAARRAMVLAART